MISPCYDGQKDNYIIIIIIIIIIIKDNYIASWLHDSHNREGLVRMYFKQGFHFQ